MNRDLKRDLITAVTLCAVSLVPIALIGWTLLHIGVWVTR